MMQRLIFGALAVAVALGSSSTAQAQFQKNVIVNSGNG